MMRARGTHRRGIALLEALVGGALLAIGLSVLVSLATQSIARQRFGEERIIVAHLLDETLNRVLAEGPLTYANGFDLQGRFDAPFQDYSFAIEIIRQNEDEPYFVSATVSWVSGGHRRSETVDTYIAEPRGVNPDETRVPGEPILR